MSNEFVLQICDILCFQIKMLWFFDDQIFYLNNFKGLSFFIKQNLDEEVKVTFSSCNTLLVTAESNYIVVRYISLNS